MCLPGRPKAETPEQMGAEQLVCSSASSHPGGCSLSFPSHCPSVYPQWPPPCPGPASHPPSGAHLYCLSPLSPSPGVRTMPGCTGTHTPFKTHGGAHQILPVPWHASGTSCSWLAIPTTSPQALLQDPSCPEGPRAAD